MLPPASRWIFRRRWSTTASFPWDPKFKTKVRQTLLHLRNDDTCASHSMQLGPTTMQWRQMVREFGKVILRNPQDLFASEEEQAEFYREIEGSDGMARMYQRCIEYAIAQRWILEYDEKSVNIADLRLPHEWFPQARAIRRKIIYHAGPTNSGKTYEALQRLKQANEDGGVYCGPLRLLALEIYEKMNTDGIYCSLLTGQERKEIPGATHVSSTVEMVNSNKMYDVAVIDEIQLITDPQRGWAWTRALASLQANEIHVCGSPEAIGLVREFAKTVNDDFELKTYDRRSELSVMDHSLGSYKKVKAGDCIVAFSRRRIFEIKREIEMKTKRKCCVIYGSLPPEIRSQQARLFNDPNSEYEVLVASDAVGMGLNLNIRRVILDSTQKWDGSEMLPVQPALIKQIVGRAGRCGTIYDKGFATCLRSADLPYVQQAYAQPPEEALSAGLFPTLDQFELFATQFPAIKSLSELLDRYFLLAKCDGSYFLCNHWDIKQCAKIIESIEMDLNDRFTFCMAPLNLRNKLSVQIFEEYARSHSLKENVPIGIYLPRTAPKTQQTLQTVETKANLIDLYLWLSLRFESTFTDREKAMALKSRAIDLVTEGLVNTTYSEHAHEKQPGETDKQVKDKSTKSRLEFLHTLFQNRNTSN